MMAAVRWMPVLALVVLLGMVFVVDLLAPYELTTYLASDLSLVKSMSGREGPLAAPTAQGEAAITGVTGNLFEGHKVRSYVGPSLFAGLPAGHNSHHTKAMALPRGSLTSAKWAVVTTIFRPSQQILDTVNLPDWAVVVVGDKGGAPFNISAPNVVYLGAEQQESWAAMLSELLRLLPWRHFGRKNLGYLYAVAHGATMIWDFDDDNGLKRGVLPSLPSKDVYRIHVDAECQVFNPYPLMGAPTEGPGAWPRGLPLSLIKSPCKYGLVPTNTDSIGVLQSLANHEPDVDGIYRLTRTIPFNFDPSKGRSLVVPCGTMTPWNAQATLVMSEAFWSMLLPVTVHGRVSDIWRSYIGQRLLWDVGKYIAFSPPLVTQLRSAHNPLADMAAEQDLYSKSYELVKFLRHWNGSTPTIAGRYEELMVQLYERNYIGLEDVLLTQQWLRALRLAGYKFPNITRDTRQKNVCSHHNQGVASYTTPQLPGSANKTSCVVMGTSYDCAAILDWRYYVQHNNLTHITNAAEAFKHWLDIGVFVGARSHAGKRVLKIVIMTKDEWPLIRSWVLYHSHVFGGENLYIIDGSKQGSDAHVWLRKAATELGVHVFDSGSVGFDVIYKDGILAILESLRYSADYLIKMDTDEFLGVQGYGHPCSQTSLGCATEDVVVGDVVRDYLHHVKVKNGSMMQIKYTMYTIPTSTCPANPASLVNYTKVVESDGSMMFFNNLDKNGLKGTKKTMFVGPAFKSIDLGGHMGQVQPQFKGVVQKLDLVLLHLHYTCYDEELQHARSAVLAHGYLHDNMTILEQRTKCEGGLRSVSNSIHKVQFLCDDLTDPNQARANYRKQFDKVSSKRFEGLANLIEILEAKPLS